MLPNGSRILGESGGDDYGLTITSSVNGVDVKKVLIGVLYSESPFSFEGYSFNKGPYLLLVALDQLQIWGDGETTSYDSFRRRQIRDSKKEMVRLSSKIDKARLEGSTNRPRFSIVQEKGEIFINVEGNKISVQLK